MSSGVIVYAGSMKPTTPPRLSVVESCSCLQQRSSPGQEELQVDEGNWVVNGHQLDTGNSEARSLQRAHEFAVC